MAHLTGPLRPNRPRLTQQQRVYIMRCYENGMGIGSTARALGVCRSTVRHHVRAHRAAKGA